MLEHCPKLQTIFLDDNFPMKLAIPKIWSCPPSVPEYISSQLRKCSIMNYKGLVSELLFAKYIRQNSRALQTMRIHFVSICDP
ncbi:hypothetical protein JHK82_018679 [Glycine max]|nr:hypothetical protein JHK87_018572 [Glycine soja]KAG5022772.1 hypothetical protein JHK85_019114 [Glycine max]KAG5037862.1 hypothetical protein JHK86_018702 [Glycine max]KAG5142984.1 hypothetical protein JHK82_018679 [Glycine max]